MTRYLDSPGTEQARVWRGRVRAADVRTRHSTAWARYKEMAKAGSQRPAVRWLGRSLELTALVVFVVGFFIVPDGAETWVLTVNLVAFYLLFLRAIAVPDRVLPQLPTYLSIEVLFLAFSYLIFYYPYQQFLLGAADLSRSVYVDDPFVDGSNKAITLATVGMLAFTIGYRALRDAGADGGEVSSEHKEHKNTTIQDFHALATASSALLLALVTLYLLAGWRSANEGRYTGTTKEAAGLEGTFMLILMLCMIVAALWVYAAAAELRRPPMLVVGLVVALTWSLRMLAFGNRTSFMLIVLVLIGGYFTFVRRAPLILLVAAFAAWMFVYRIIDAVRSVPNWYRSGNLWELLYQSQNYQQSSSESGLNITTIGMRATVEMVPATHDFTYGALKFIQFAAIVPFSGSLYGSFVHPVYTTSSEMLRDIMVSPWSSWDPGTNVISDPYIDFGVPGVVLILFAIGLTAKAIRNYVARDPYDAHRVVMYLLTMSLFALLPRFATDISVRLLAWALIFSLLTRAVSRRRRS